AQLRIEQMCWPGEDMNMSRAVLRPSEFSDRRRGTFPLAAKRPREGRWVRWGVGSSAIRRWSPRCRPGAHEVARSDNRGLAPRLFRYHGLQISNGKAPIG